MGKLLTIVPFFRIVPFSARTRNSLNTRGDMRNTIGWAIVPGYVIFTVPTILTVRALLTASILCCPMLMAATLASHPNAAEKKTSLTDATIKYEVAAKGFAVLERAGIKAVIVNNDAVDAQDIPGHRGGYSGVASLTHEKQSRNIFVPAYAGLNFEHIHDGTLAGLKEKFEPRKFPMELRVINSHCVELYQPPTGNWKLESCGRYELLNDGTIQYTFECIPRTGGYRNGYIGLFWASYISTPEVKSIHFRGRLRGSKETSKWIEGVTPKHGEEATHSPVGVELLKMDEDFPLTLVNHPSKYEYADPYYYGVSHQMALVQVFRQRDGVWMAQSPTGGGAENPAWDFQWFIKDYKVNEAYGFVMRAAYVPYLGQKQLTELAQRHIREMTQ